MKITGIETFVIDEKAGLEIDLNKDRLRKHPGSPRDAGFWKNVFLD